MPNLKYLRTRVKSIKSTQKISKAVHVVAAAKLKRNKDQMLKANDYTYGIANIIEDMLVNTEAVHLSELEHKFFGQQSTKIETVLLILVTSERGLCGGFNATVIKKVKSDIEKYESEGKKVQLLVIGKKGYEACKIQYLPYIVGAYNIVNNNYEQVMKFITEQIIELFNNVVDACYIYYNEFKNAITQVLVVDQVLPLYTPTACVTENKQHDNQFVMPVPQSNQNGNYEYEGQNLVSMAIKLSIYGKVSRVLLHSKTSEEGARMTVMDNATRNAHELILQLTLKLNRSRQTMITNDLIEIISSAEAI